MNKLLKLLRANENHKTRFHTERGLLMPLSSFARIPKALWYRLSGKYKFMPWIVPETVSWLEKNMREEWQVFEFGSGWSTIWYAKHCRHIVSVEDNAGWNQVVEGRVKDQGVKNCELRLASLNDFISIISSFPNDYFDLIIIDSSEEQKNLRIEALEASMSKVRPGGYILLDDSDRPQNTVLPHSLDDWGVLRFVGIKPFPLMAIETSIFQRPSVGAS